MRPLPEPALPAAGGPIGAEGAPARPTFLFETTTAALWAEEVAEARGIPAELVPAPAGSRARCDLALVTLPDRADDLAAGLKEAGVPTRRWS